MIRVARQFFNDARRRKLILENPFDGISANRGPDGEREYFVTREEIKKLLEVLLNNEWRLVVALVRFAALRCPSEVLALRWSDINWAT